MVDLPVLGRSMTPVLAAVVHVCLSPVARAQEPDNAIAAVETDDGGARDLPGHPQTPHARPTPEPVTPPPPAPAPRDWFGGKPWLEWGHMTGDWGGARTGLEHLGLSINGSLTYDWTSVYSGGVRHTASTRSLLDINASLDMDVAAGIKGNTIFVDFQSTDVRGGSRDVGDVQGISNIDSGDNVHQLAELWCEQKLFENTLRVKVGKIDANKEFDSLTCGGAFSSSSVGFSPTVLTLPTFPDPALGALIFWYPTEQLSFGAGVFDGSLAAGSHTGRLGISPLLHGNEYFFDLEAGLNWKRWGSLGKGRVAIGGWANTGRFARLDGGSKRTTAGEYLVIEQQLTMRGSEGDDADKGLYVFGRLGHADAEIAAITNHAAIGLSLVGTFEGRGDDAAGMVVSYADLAGAAQHDETSLEAYYKIALTPFLSITPDLQVIVHPGGVPGAHTAVVGGVRIQAAF